MEQRSLNQVNVTLLSPSSVPFEREQSLYKKRIDALNAALSKAGNQLPTVVAPTLREAFALVCAAAKGQDKPCYLAPLDAKAELDALLFQCQAPSPQKAPVAGPMLSAMLKGGLLVFGGPGLNQALVYRFFSVLAGSKSIDLPSLGTSIDIDPGFQIVLAFDEDSMPDESLRQFMNTPVNVDASQEETKDYLKSQWPDSPSALLSDIAVLLGKARELGESASIYESHRLADRLLGRKGPWTREELQASTGDTLGQEVARIVERDKLLSAFQELETEADLEALRQELDDE